VPVEAKPLFRPDVLRAHLEGLELPPHVDALRPKLAHWADLICSGKANTFKEQEILPDFLTDFFCELLGYTRPADGGPRYTISREKHVQVEGEFADAVLGDFGRGPDKFVVALEGKGPKDPLDRPFGGRRLSAVEQGYSRRRTFSRRSSLPVAQPMHPSRTPRGFVPFHGSNSA